MTRGDNTTQVGPIVVILNVLFTACHPSFWSSAQETRKYPRRPGNALKACDRWERWMFALTLYSWPLSRLGIFTTSSLAALF